MGIYHSHVLRGATGAPFLGSPTRLANNLCRRVHDALRYRATAGRRAIRIVHAGCGSGSILIDAVMYARLLDFVAIEGRGFDPSSTAIAVALRSSANWHDPRIGLTFDVANLSEGIATEGEHTTDLFLCARSELDRTSAGQRANVLKSIRRVADRLIVVEP